MNKERKEQIKATINARKEMRGNASDAYFKLMLGMALTEKESRMLYEYIYKLEKKILDLEKPMTHEEYYM